MKMNGFQTLFIALMCSRMAPVHALRRNGVACTADGQCNSGACYLGQNGDNRSGTCHCRGRCTISGCAGCPSEQMCNVPSGKLEANTCTNMDGSIVAPDTMRSVAVGEKCARDAWCAQGVCYKGRYGYDQVGVCECKECSNFWGCGGCDGRSKCLAFANRQMNQCVANGRTESPTYYPTQPTSTPTKFPMIDVPIGKNCGLDEHCLNGCVCAAIFTLVLLASAFDLLEIIVPFCVFIGTVSVEQVVNPSSGGASAPYVPQVDVAAAR